MIRLKAHPFSCNLALIFNCSISYGKISCKVVKSTVDIPVAIDIVATATADAFAATATADTTAAATGCDGYGSDGGDGGDGGCGCAGDDDGATFFLAHKYDLASTCMYDHRYPSYISN